MEQTNEAMFCFPLYQAIFQILTLSKPFKYLYSYQSSKLEHSTNSTNLNAAHYARIYYCSDGKIKETARQRYLIPAGIDQNLCAQSRMPMDMMVQGWSISLFQASQQSATMSS